MPVGRARRVGLRSDGLLSRYVSRVSCRRLGQVCVVAAVVVVLAYVIFVLTSIGQRIDDEVLEALRAEKLTRTALTSALHLINVITIGLLLAVVLVISGARHRLPAGLWAVGGFVVAVVTSEVLKRVLPRPELQEALDEAVGKAGINTFPSGHSTIVTAGIIALLWAWGARERWAWWLGGFVIVAVAGATVVAGWHRPSDAIGGIAVGIAGMSGTAWLSGCAGARKEPNSATA